MRSDALGSQKRAKTRTKTTKKRKNPSVSKMKDRVVTINSVQESSKSELSSRGKRPFKVFRCVFFFADTGTEPPLCNALAEATRLSQSSCEPGSRKPNPAVNLPKIHKWPFGYPNGRGYPRRLQKAVKVVRVPEVPERP